MTEDRRDRLSACPECGEIADAVTRIENSGVAAVTTKENVVTHSVDDGTEKAVWFHFDQ